MLSKEALMFMLMMLLWNVCSKPSITIKRQLEIIEEHVNASVILEKQDNLLIKAWTEDLSLQFVNITTKYRMQVTRHQRSSFRKVYHNEKWTDCMEIHKRDIDKSERLYYEKERECLREANSAYIDKKDAINQVEKELRKWRKSFKYLKNLCKTDHYDNEDGYGMCLVEYVLKDNYNVTLQRLILLKLQFMKELYLQMEAAKLTIDDCLKAEFSAYLTNIRIVVNTLNKCYRFKY